MCIRSTRNIETDGESHFDNREVKAWCEARRVQHHVVAAYAPWVNGLVESTNRQLLGRLCRMCSPGLDDVGTMDARPEDVARTWPDHFNDAICHLNEHIIPAIQFSPKELLLGLVVNTTRMPLVIAAEKPCEEDTNIHFAYVAQQRLDASDLHTLRAQKQKINFDDRVLLLKQGVVMFEKGDLVQVHNMALEHTKRCALARLGTQCP